MSETIDKIQRFCFDRLPRPPEPHNKKPCLAEDWFVSDARPIAPNWLGENDLRRVWRVARMQRLGLSEGVGCPWLLLHQVTDLTKALFEKAESIIFEQRKELSA